MTTFELNSKLVDRERALIEIERLDCEESLYEFLRIAWKYIDPAPWKDGWPIQVIAEHLQAVVDGEIRNLLINLPPRLGKSSVCSVAFPAWVWTQSIESPVSGPQVPFLHASYDISLSLRDSVKCRRLIESPWYQERWGHRFKLTSDQNTKSRFTNDRGGERLITSIGGTVTGEGGNIICIDDANAANEAFSDAKTQAVIDWWDQTMSSRLNDPNTGAYIVIQQRLAENDLSGHILEHESENWTHLVLPMHYEPERSFTTSIGWKDPRTKPGELLWPERFDEKAVKTLEKKMGKFIAAGQLEQRPEPKGGGVIQRDWWILWDKPTYPTMDYVIAWVDTAFTENTMNDQCAMIVWGVWNPDARAAATRIVGQDGQPIYADRVYDIAAPKAMMIYAWAEHMEFFELVTKIVKTARACKVDTVLIENKANGISVAQEIRRLYADEHFGVRLEDPKSMDKLARLYSVQHIFEEKIVYAPETVWSDKVITQVGQFPAGRFDDLVDCVSGGLSFLRKIGLIVREVERETEIESLTTYPGGQNAPLYPV